MKSKGLADTPGNMTMKLKATQLEQINEDEPFAKIDSSFKSSGVGS